MQIFVDNIAIIVAAVFGALIGGVINSAISNRRAKVDIALSVWPERAAAYREIFANCVRMKALLNNVRHSNKHERNDIKSAFISFRERSIFIDRVLADQIHNCFAEVERIVKSEDQSHLNIGATRDELDRLKMELQQDAGFLEGNRIL